MPSDQPDVYNALCVYRELGMKLGKLEKYENGLKSFDQALKRQPQDMRALRGRAKCRAQTSKHLDALKDIRKMKEIKPDNIYVAGDECLLEYLCCEFERAMIDNTNKIPTRKKPDNFIMGTMHCEDAIRNNIGKRSGHPLRDHFQIIRKLAWTKTYEKAIPFHPKSKHKKKLKKLRSSTMEGDKELIVQLAVPKAELAKPPESKRAKERHRSAISIQMSGVVVPKSGTSLGNFGAGSKKLDNILTEGSSIEDSLSSIKITGLGIPPLEQYPFKPIQSYTTNIENYMAERYLDKMYQDKSFLKNLKNHSGVKCPNNFGTKKIINLSQKCTKYIQYNQEILRARRPFFLLRYQDGKAGGKLRERQLERERAKTKYNETQVQKIIDKVKWGISTQNLRQIIEFGEKMYTFCENTPKKTLPNRINYLRELYNLARDGYYNLNSLKSSMTQEEGLIRIAIILGIPREKSSLDPLLREFKDYFVDRRRQCQIYERRVRESTNREQLIWLYHELSRLYYERKEYAISKAYGTKCLRESYFVKDDKSKINSMFLIIRTQIAIKNKNAAKIALRSCRNIALRIEDHKVAEFIDKCIDLLNETPMDNVEPVKLLEMRKQNIIQLMPTISLKNKAKYIFQRISELPPSKRISVLPGIEHPEKRQQGV